MQLKPLRGGSEKERERAETFIRFTMRVAGRFEDAAPAWPASAWAGHGEHASCLLAWPGLAWPNMLDMLDMARLAAMAAGVKA